MIGLDLRRNEASDDDRIHPFLLKLQGENRRWSEVARALMDIEN